jgi:deoxyhypusine synthase
MTPAGVGGAIISLMERGAIDFMVSTGANLYHDIHYALDFALHRGTFKLSDPDLHEAGVIRIYDVLFREEVLLDTDRFIRECVKTFPQRPMSTAELHHLLGRRLLEIGVDPQNSVVAMAARWNVPIYTSSPGDSSIGMNLARHQLDGGALTIDPLYDIHETTAIVHAATRNGVIILGGGSPKNFYLQTQPQLWEVLGINKGGHDYFIQITQDAPHWGGLSGATPTPTAHPRVSGSAVASHRRDQHRLRAAHVHGLAQRVRALEKGRGQRHACAIARRRTPACDQLTQRRIGHGLLDARHHELGSSGSRSGDYL